MDTELAAASPRSLEAGGGDPDMGSILQESMDAFAKDMGPYILAGVGQFIVVLPVSLGLAMGAYVLGLVGLVAGSVASVFTIMLGSMLGDAGAALGAIVGMLLPFAGFFAAFLIVVPLAVLIMAPLNASLVRAVAAHQRGEKPLDFSSSFSTATEDLPRVLAVGMALTAITMVALCMCYIPALLVPLVFGFVNTLVILHRRGPLQAFIQNFQHMKGHSASHLIMGALQMALGMLAGMLPVIGPMFALDMHVRAHRRMFGDGSEPVII